MARNMIAANEKIFSKLAELVKKSSLPAGSVARKRYIKTNEREREWLKNLSVGKQQPILPRLKTAQLSFENKEYFVVAGGTNSNIEDDNEFIRSIDLNAGLATALLSELSIPVRQGISEFQVINDILPEYMGAEGYEGHDYLNVCNFFEPLLVYEIQDDSPLRGDDLTRISGYYLCKNRDSLTLPYSEETIQLFLDHFVEAPFSVPYENLLQSIIAVQWRHSFLEAYRCIEFLFSNITLKRLHQDLALQIPLLDFSTKMEALIGWRPQEKDAINELFCDIPANAISLLKEVRNHMGESNEANLGPWFYRVRNAIVHYRHTTNRVELEDSYWDKLLRGTLLLINHTYKKYDLELTVSKE